ncbi:MAG: OsmC family protein [Acidobacteria bacterium]|nr:OsmC family protein [Acidobacteriota bacterium]
MRDVRVRLVSESGFETEVQVGVHVTRCDEPIDKGGTDTGPTPQETLLAALGACEAITLRMYASRKGWLLRDAKVHLNASFVDGVYVIKRQLTLEGDLDDDQRARLHDIANRCPVQRAITGEVRIEDV